MGPNIRSYINNIWDKQVFLLRQSGFYSNPLSVDRGCTQGDTDSPIIFNIIIDAVIRKWTEEKNNNTSRALFYADDGLIENEDPDTLQQDLDLIIGLFEKVGLRTNESKTKFMVFRGPSAPKAISKQAYYRMVTGKGKTYNERRKERVQCTICGKEMCRGSLQRHMEKQHNLKPERYLYSEKETQTTSSSFKVKIIRGKRNKCPIPGCPGESKDKFGMYRHFCLKHVETNLIIDGDGQCERCNKCGMFAINMAKHQKTVTCEKVQGRRKNEDLQNKQAAAETVGFKVYGKDLEQVKDFRYLGRTINNNDDDTDCIHTQIKKARKQWNSLSKILKNEGSNAKTMAKFYMAVVQAVLLYGAESWTITERNWKRLESFQNRAVRYMTGKHIRKNGDGSWSYPNHYLLEKECGLFPIRTYIKRRRGTLRKYLEDNREPLLEEAKKLTAPARNSQKVLWWRQSFISKEEMKNMQNFWFK